MPRLGRQCITTVSPALTWVTPGPVSTTCPDASWPSRCGRNLSGPLTAAISLICAPQIDVWKILTRTWPASSVSGNSISSMISGLRDSTRMAALADFTCIGPSSLEVDEFVIAGIAEVVVEPDPRRHVVECLCSQRPAFHVELLELAPVTLDHDVLVLADALDLLHRGLQFEHLQIVQRAERDHEIERFVAERIRVLRAIAEQIVPDFFLGIGEAMLGDVEADDLGFRQQQLEFVQQESLAATDVENPALALEAMEVDQQIG